LGHSGDVRDIRGLFAAGIAAVVDLAIHEVPAPAPRELVYCRFPIVDGTGNPPWLLRAAVETVAGLIREGVPTLVGCGLGLSRSPCIAGAAIARVRGCPADEGLAVALKSAPADVSAALWAEVRPIADRPT
jgi:protein-tyrosine phosphatase